ncbi:hypothetical protein F5Y10DRAFT_269861 [Nemania abortiva]|nr:hypothetical protein F5Y10DRAFT_269861 [Nemania abortiva]
MENYIFDSVQVSSIESNSVASQDIHFREIGIRVSPTLPGTVSKYTQSSISHPAFALLSSPSPQLLRPNYIVSKGNIADSGSSFSEDQRRRPRYSIHKCSQCRKDKQKCEPAQRQWPGQKCHRCQQKDFACSEGLTTKGEAMSQPNPDASSSQMGNILSGSILKSSSVLREFFLAFDWYQILMYVLRIASEETEILGQRASKWDRGVFWAKLTTELHHAVCGVHAILRTRLSHIQTHTQSFQVRDTPHLIQLTAQRMTGRIDISEDWGVLSSLLDQVERDKDASCGGLSTVLASQVAELYSLLRRNCTMDELRVAARAYIDGLYSFWGCLSNICDQATAFRIPAYLKTPLSFELLFSESGYYAKQIIGALSRVEPTFVMLQDSLGRTLLHVAAEKFTYGNFGHVLEHGIDVNAVDYLGRTALHVACKNVNAFRIQDQRIIIASLLRRENCNISIRDEYGFLALDYAIQDHRKDILEMFRDIRNIQLDPVISSILKAQVAETTARRYAKDGVAAEYGKS